MAVEATLGELTGILIGREREREGPEPNFLEAWISSLSQILLTALPCLGVLGGGGIKGG